MSGATLPNSGERNVAAMEKRAPLNERVFVLPLRGEGLNAAQIRARLSLTGATLSNSGE